MSPKVNIKEIKIQSDVGCAVDVGPLCSWLKSCMLKFSSHGYLKYEIETGTRNVCPRWLKLPLEYILGAGIRDCLAVTCETLSLVWMFLYLLHVFFRLQSGTAFKILSR